jgi:hypothetical protein
MIGLRDKMHQWSSMTYGEIFDQRVATGQYGNDDETIALTQRVLKAQRLEDKPMTGDSTNGLLKTESEVGKFQYVKVFNIISQNSDWAPIDMVYGTCYLARRDPQVKEKARQWGMSEDQLITKMCGRALRALPSYIREHDLRQQLEQRLPGAKFEQSEELDTMLHADLVMERDGQTYYFWSFTNTPQSIENFQDKFLGHRAGEIPGGYHVTCPFSMEFCDDVDGWKLYDSYAVGAIARMTKYQANTDYNHVEEMIAKRGSYFTTPKLVIKQDEPEREIVQDFERPIGNR